MSKHIKGCHVKTQVPVISTYTFKWSIENFSKLLMEKEIKSPYFYPCPDIIFYTTLQKFSSYLVWKMCIPASENIDVGNNISIVDSSGKLWITKENSIENRQDKSPPTAPITFTYYYGLIDKDDKINITDLYSLRNEVVTFSCFMRLTSFKLETQILKLESADDLDKKQSLEKLSNDLETMYRASLYTDARLRIGTDESLRVHKAILCGRSPVFAKMFVYNLEEQETNVIDIADLEINVLKDLISFLYTACVPNDSFEAIYSLYYAADKYEVADLRKFCGEILTSKMTVENACQVLSLADRHFDHTLKDTVMTFMDIYLEPIMVTEQWTIFVNEETKLAAEVIRTRSTNNSLEPVKEVRIKSNKGCHIRTRIPMTTYTFKWSIDHFSKLSLEKEIRSPDFYPSFGIGWFSTLQKYPSYLIWTMHNPTSQKVSVEYNISIVDSNGKLWIKKKLYKPYKCQRSSLSCNLDSPILVSPLRLSTGIVGVRQPIYVEKVVIPSYLKEVLIDNSDQINIAEMYRLNQEAMTFSCFMIFNGHEIETTSFKLESHDVDNRKNVEKLSNDLKTMYDVSLYTDVRLRIGTNCLRVHKAILCGRSPVFAKMFEHNLEEKETNVIDIADLEMNVLKDLISFLYTACLPNDKFDTIYSLYYAADKYEVADLRKLCGEILTSKLTVENACQVLSLADRHFDHTLKDTVKTFIDTHLEPIMATEGWTNLINEETKLTAEVILTLSKRKSSENGKEKN